MMQIEENFLVTLCKIKKKRIKGDETSDYYKSIRKRNMERERKVRSKKRKEIEITNEKYWRKT